MGHHVDRVDRLARTFRRDFLHHRVGHAVGALSPGIDHLVVLFALGDQAVHVLLFEFLHLGFGLGNHRFLGSRDHEIVLAERNAGAAGVGEAEAHHPVAEDDRLFLTAEAIDFVDQGGDVLLRQNPVDQVEFDLRVTRQHFGQQHAARGGFDTNGDRIAVFVDRLVAGGDLGLQADRTGVQRLLDFAGIAEHHALALLVLALHGHVVQTQHDILRRNDNRLAVGGAEDVVGRHHQHARFELRIERQRNVHGHLVTVKVGVEGGADQRVQLNGLTFDQHRFERLDAQTVQGRRTVQHDRVFADDFFQDIPNFGTFLFKHALGGLDGRRHAVQFQLGIDERLE